jgi:hypothetical protein
LWGNDTLGLPDDAMHAILRSGAGLALRLSQVMEPALKSVAGFVFEVELDR